MVVLCLIAGGLFLLALVNLVGVPMLERNAMDALAGWCELFGGLLVALLARALNRWDHRRS